jgi:hypothetical protein
LTSDDIRRLLKKELGAKLIPDDDNTRIQRWSPTLEEIRKRQEEMGLFAHLEGKVDVESIPVNPFEYPDGVYVGMFKGATQRPLTGDAGYEVSLDLQWEIQDDDVEEHQKYIGKPIRESKWIPSAFLAETDAKLAEEKAGYVIQRIAQLGFGDEAATVDLEDINAACMNQLYRIKLKKGSKEDSQQFISWVKLIKPEDEDDLSNL